MLTNRKQVYLAAGGSLLLHLLVLLTWALAVRWLPTPRPAAPTPPPIHLEIIKAEETPPPAAEETPTPTPRAFLDTSSRTATEHPPTDPKFESNQDTEAASRLPATGDAPLPSQKGKITPSFAFDTTPFTPGAAPAVASAAPASAPPPPVATPVPRPTPSHTPVPDDEFGLPAPTPTPEDAEPPFDPTLRGPASTMPERPTVASRSANASNAAGFQSNQRMTSVNGSIGRSGDANVDSVATPVGRYKGGVIHAIEQTWNAYFAARSDIVAIGMVRIHFIVDRTGRVLSPQVVSNTSNEALAAVSLQALHDAPIPPMPAETAAAMRGELSVDLSFDSQ